MTDRTIWGQKTGSITRVHESSNATHSGRFQIIVLKFRKSTFERIIWIMTGIRITTANSNQYLKENRHVIWYFHSWAYFRHILIFVCKLKPPSPVVVLQGVFLAAIFSFWRSWMNIINEYITNWHIVWVWSPNSLSVMRMRGRSALEDKSKFMAVRRSFLVFESRTRSRQRIWLVIWALRLLCLRQLGLIT